MRPRRSVLYTPGDHEKRLRKALGLGVDVAVMDLEDAVAPAHKEAARETVRRVLETEKAAETTERAVRLNPLQSDLWALDLEAVLPGSPDAIVVPKAEEPGAVRELARRLDAAGSHARLILILETARGVLRAPDLADAHDRVDAIVFGAEDLAADVGARRRKDNQEVLYARSRVALAAGAAGIQALDMVYVDFRDEQGLREEAGFGRDLGYVGKQIIHPNQIQPVHEAFSPSAEEVEAARKLLAAVDEADVGEGGVINYEGRMIDRPLIEQARRTVALADRTP